MWTEVLAITARVLAPWQKNTGTGQGEVALAVTGSTAYFIIPSWAYGRYCEFTSDVGVDIQFGDNTGLSLVYGQQSGVASHVITVNTATGRRIHAQTVRSFVVPMPATGATLYMAAIASGNGTLWIGPSSGVVVNY